MLHNIAGIFVQQLAVRQHFPCAASCLFVLLWLVCTMYVRVYVDVLCVFIVCFYRAVSPCGEGKASSVPFKWKCWDVSTPMLGSESCYKQVIPLFIIHLESLADNFDHTFLLCHQKHVAELGTLLFSSHETHEIYSACKYKNWLNCSQMEPCTNFGCELYVDVYVNFILIWYFEELR
jgi:hypothetical protein